MCFFQCASKGQPRGRVTFFEAGKTVLSEKSVFFLINEKKTKDSFGFGSILRGQYVVQFPTAL